MVFEVPCCRASGKEDDMAHRISDSQLNRALHDLPDNAFVMMFGGLSTEHDASLAGYRNICANLLQGDGSAHLKFAIYVGRDGQIFRVDGPDFPASETELRRLQPLSFDELAQLLRNEDAFVFNLLHGTGGEDGVFQGWAEVHGIRGSFGPVLPNSVGMAKWVTSAVAEKFLPGLNTPQTMMVRRGIADRALRDVPLRFGSRWVVVKPGSMGASLLTTKVQADDATTLAARVAEIHRFDDVALVQEFVDGQEYSCGVIEVAGCAEPLPCVRITTGRPFFDHEAKHRPGAAHHTIVDDDLAKDLQCKSADLFQVLGIFGWARFDYLVGADGRVWFLEVNTLPGMMAGSIFPEALAASGRTFSDLIRLLAAAEAATHRNHRVLRYEIGS